MQHGATLLKSAVGDVLVEVGSTSSLRDVRSALMGLAYKLLAADERRLSGVAAAKRPALTAVFVLSNSRVQEDTLGRELVAFRAAVREDLRERIAAVLANEHGDVDCNKLPTGAPTRLPNFIAALVKQHARPAIRAGRVTRKSVKAVMLESYIAARGVADRMPSSIVELQRVTGASYPTVAGALKDLAGGQALRSNGVQLLRPEIELWRATAYGFASERRSKRYVDPTGHATRPEKLLAMLHGILGRSIASSNRGRPGMELAIGGVFGAKMLYPGLDISAAMRLDICVYDGDERFMGELDPGLVSSEDRSKTPAVVLHFTRDIRPNVVSAGQTPSADTGDPQLAPASAVECYADLLEMGYVGEAREFALALTREAP